MELGLAGRKAVVTGGSKGLGRAIAEELASEGMDVAICSRTEDEVRAAGEELRRRGVTVHAQAADVTDPAQVERFIAAAAEALGGIDVLVNNAGRAHPGTFATLTDEDWRDDLDVKLFSMIRCSREAIPHMRARGGGRIININAVYAKYPDPSFFATSTNRAASVAFTKTLSMELAKERILVNSVNIGFVVTPQWENIHQKRAPELSREEFFARMAADEVPLGRFGTPEEVSGIVAFLASERASYITGASIDVAGGMGRYL
ncbi:MAG TPA: SDR family oxidoreductase [Actinomycetota bacterium]